MIIKTIPKIQGNIRESLLVHVSKQSYNYFSERLTGTLSNQVLDVASRFEYVAMHLSVICFVVVHVITSSVLLYHIHAVFCGFLSIWFIVYAIFLVLWLKRNTSLSQHHAKTHNAFHPKETVGLVGFSGSGKTTLIHLLLRHFDVKSGRILIDDQDISHVTQDSLRRSISYIPQDTTLFHRSLRENLVYGNNQIEEEEMIRASKIAHCHEFVMQLEEGYDSVVGEGGMKLSGGQRQRIAIARAILKKVPIFILDEATSALDSVTEKQIQTNLWEFMQERTTIIIAHRLSTLQHVDRILVFKQGTIIEQGTHKELLASKGHYNHLWNHQVDGLLPDKKY